ncbi:GDSL esterase/lipase At1g29670-like [Impatiens glandulifera]|uniref:GDSL esterase/lipase At1g29670-like n=1 Tax=Impatiens glandulifera TaxID=253017 RepID=UPI001FB08358|nr:GDSL esterase/lipase At1g29670-like [Impatiens glandulifera]
MARNSTAVISGFGILVCVMFFFLSDGRKNLQWLIQGFQPDSLLLLKENQFSRKPQVPCYFIFGDSLVDNGNNNHLQTSAKANFAPYGIDFPRGPTGRFSNGRTYVDFLAEFLGFKRRIPPFATAREESILTGVNYGSGGAGILDMTGQSLGEVISLNKQLRNHRSIVNRIANKLRSKELADRHLNRCLYTVGMGNNDYLNNYLSSNYPTSQLYTPEQYATLLVQKFSHQLKKLYKLGARKIGVSEVGLLGCLPGVMGINGSACVGFINDYAELFNSRLGPVIDGLNANLTDATFILLPPGNSTVPGVTILNAPCCNVTSSGECYPNQMTCKNRTSYYFWDAFHPTEQVYKSAALNVYNVISTSILKEKARTWRIFDQ